MTTPVGTIEHSAFSQYQHYLQALFAPEDTLAFAFIQNGQPTQHIFTSAKRAFTEEFFGELSDENNFHNYSIYVAMNPFKPELVGQNIGRTKENVEKIKRLYADADEHGDETLNKVLNSKVTPTPSVVLNTSPGKYQFIWNVEEGMTQDQAEQILKGLAQEFDTDAAVAEVSRVLRIPGFKNQKYPEAPEIAVVGDINPTIYAPKDFNLTVKTIQTVEVPRDPAGLIPHGFLHNELLSEAGRLRHDGYEIDIIEPALVSWAHKNCAPPIDIAEVRKIARSVCDSFPAGRNTDLLLTQTQTLQPTPATVDTTKWRDAFRSVGEMEQGEIDMVIEGVLQEGICFIGANPSDGKTLMGLSWAKAICTGAPLFGLPQFQVKKPRTVVYLIPESRDRAFRKRCVAFRMPDDKMKFMTRTISAGLPMELSDPMLLQAIRETNAVVFLDTAARFMKGNDENSSAQNRELVNDVLTLLSAGAVCVVLIHHATKAAKAKKETMTLENMLRGSSDLGAMCDQAYGLRKDMGLYSNRSGPMEIDIVNLKDREDIGGLSTLRLAASYSKAGMAFPVSHIDESGDFKVVSNVETTRRSLEVLVGLVKFDPNLTAKELSERTGETDYMVRNNLSDMGWHRVKGGGTGASPWHRDNGGSCPYAPENATQQQLNKAMKYLQQTLAGTGPTAEYTGMTEAEILLGADEHGISELFIGKAKKRIGVVVDKKTRQWSLPPDETPVAEIIN